MKDQNNWRLEMPVRHLQKQMGILTKVRRKRILQRGHLM